ncbi:MAG: hypothetical protein HY901_08315 [Deltaproteobacteria bacterium]|nr:hypothetical protein [Deltaproteobacteria bacterium]
MAAAVYLKANGLTLAGVALASLCPTFGLLAAARFKPAAALLVAELAFVGWRLSGTMPKGWRYCENRDCGRAPWWSHLAPESEAVFAGLELSHLAGVVGDSKHASFHNTFREAYESQADVEGGLPNPLLLWSTRETVRTLVRVPPGAARAPCVVFLHGFGGLLTPYMEVIATGLPGYVVVAPQLDDVGGWGSPRGEAVVKGALAALPPEVDRSRVFLVGLSNGSLQGTRYSPLFAKAVLLSGLGDTGGGHLLAISGRSDQRVSFEFIESEARALRARGVDVAVRRLDADHGLILTHSREWTAIAAQFFEGKSTAL